MDDDIGEMQVAAHVGEWLTFRVLLNTTELRQIPHDEWVTWGVAHHGRMGTPICVHCHGACSYALGKWPLHPTCYRWLRDVYYPRNGEVRADVEQRWVLNSNKRNGR